MSKKEEKMLVELNKREVDEALSYYVKSLIEKPLDIDKYKKYLTTDKLDKIIEIIREYKRTIIFRDFWIDYWNKNKFILGSTHFKEVIFSNYQPNGRYYWETRIMFGLTDYKCKKIYGIKLSSLQKILNILNEVEDDIKSKNR